MKYHKFHTQDCKLVDDLISVTEENGYLKGIQDSLQAIMEVKKELLIDESVVCAAIAKKLSKLVDEKLSLSILNSESK